MAKKTKQDPTGQRANRRRADREARRRLDRAERLVKAMFKRIPRTRRRQTQLTNSVKPFISFEVLRQEISRAFDSGKDIRPLIASATETVYDYTISPAELEQFNADIRRILNDVLLQTQTGRVPPEWWWKENVEQASRQGAAEEVVQYNQLIAQALAAGLLGAMWSDRRLTPAEVLLTPEYQAAVGRQYVQNFGAFKTLSDRTADQVIQVINAGIEAGMTPTEITEMIVDRFNVSRSSATRTTFTQINWAYNDGRIEATKIAGRQTGLRAGVLHISALIKTTRPTHAVRHGNVYTPDAQQRWWNTGSNRINCHCTTRTVLVDSNGDVLDAELQEQIQVERTFFDQ